MTDSVTTTAADLKRGDFFQHNDVHPEPVEVLSVHKYTSRPYASDGAERVLVVYPDTGGTPQPYRLWANDEVHRATDAEVAAVKAGRERAAFIEGIHEFANWLEANPQLPQPTRAVFQHSMTAGTDAEKIATVRAAAEHLGVAYDSSGDPSIWVEPLPGFEYLIHGFITHADATAADVPDPAGDDAGAVTRYFSFGHGQTDPDTGEDLLDKYVTVIAPTVEACRDAMFASRYGQAWAFDYDPADPTWREWGPQWTEHERIVADVPDPHDGSYTT